jgi:hypothetical protein
MAYCLLVKLSTLVHVSVLPQYGEHLPLSMVACVLVTSHSNSSTRQCLFLHTKLVVNQHVFTNIHDVVAKFKVLPLQHKLCMG